MEICIELDEESFRRRVMSDSSSSFFAEVERVSLLEAEVSVDQLELVFVADFKVKSPLMSELTSKHRENLHPRERKRRKEIKRAREIEKERDDWSPNWVTQTNS